MIVTLRLLHIVSGVLWVGMVFLTSMFLVPALYDSGPSAGPVMQALQRRRLMTAIPVTAIVALLSGLTLYYVVSDGFNRSYMHSSMGRTLGIGAGFTIVAWIVGMTVLRPSTMRAGELAASMATVSESERPAKTAELTRLRARAIVSGRIVSALLLLAVAMMAIARYV